MNNIISCREIIYIYRRISNTIKHIADVMPVVIVTGARQVGKSTPLQQEFSAKRGIIVHGGDDLFWLHSKVIAVPWWWIDL